MEGSAAWSLALISQLDANAVIRGVLAIGGASVPVGHRDHPRLLQDRWVRQGSPHGADPWTLKRPRLIDDEEEKKKTKRRGRRRRTRKWVNVLTMQHYCCWWL